MRVVSARRVYRGSWSLLLNLNLWNGCLLRCARSTIPAAFLVALAFPAVAA